MEYKSIFKRIWQNFKREEVSIISLFIILSFFIAVDRMSDIRADGTAVPEMVTNMNIVSISDIDDFVVIDSTSYFYIDDGVSGKELWKSDGTTLGTVMVKDINPGAGDSSPRDLTAINSTLYFYADDGTNGVEFWKSDGTATGTEMVKDINPGANSSAPSGFTSVNGVIYFMADDGVSGWEVWKSDGTASGTEMVKDINTGGGTSNPINMYNVNGTLFFSADDGVNGAELWKSDGTEVGTVMVKDIFESGGSNPAKFLLVNGTLYFSAKSNTGYDLWKSDGTEVGTVKIYDFPSVADNSDTVRDLVNLNGGLYFVANELEGTGIELWKSDGTATGTVIVKDINPSGDTNQTNLTIVGTLLYFTTPGDEVGGEQLWKSDGTEVGTVMVKDFSNIGVTSPSYFINTNNTLYFTAADSTNGRTLWKSDGTDEGTAIVADVNPGVTWDMSHLFKIGSTLYFTDNDGVNGVQLWKLAPSIPNTLTYTAGANGYISGSSTQVVEGGGDGLVVYAVADNGYHFVEWSDATTTNPRLDLNTQSDITVTATFATGSWPVMVRDINIGINSSNASGFTDVGDLTYLVADDGIYGYELWKSDGTPEGTVMVKDVYPGISDSNIDYETLIDINGTLYFSADDGVNGSELWKSDGTTGGTEIVMDINPGVDGSSPSNFVNLNGTLYFSAFDGVNSSNLWKSDGTEAGTSLVVNSGYNPSVSYSLLKVNNLLYFFEFNGSYGWVLWKSDGTEAGTVLIKTINPGGIGDPTPFYVKNVNNDLFFILNYSTTTSELWKSDGTEAGTVLIKTINPGVSGSYLQSLLSVGDTLYFTADEGINGNELWKSDGTASGTVMVKDINQSGDSLITFPIVMNDVLYFSASDGTHSNVWKSDGTESGTIMFGPESNSFSAAYLSNIENTLYFNGYNDLFGSELWRSDGTAIGTEIVKDVAVSGDLGLSYLKNINGTLYFSAENGIHGTELWKYTPVSSIPISTPPITTPNPAFTSGGSYFINLLLNTSYNDLVNSTQINSTNSGATSSIINNRLSLSTTTKDSKVVSPVLARINTESAISIPVSGKKIKKEKHTIKTLSVNTYTNTATVQIRSNPQVVNIKLGENVNLDLNNDSILDVSIELTNIHNNNSPELTVRSLLPELKTESKPITKVATTTYVFNRDYKIGTISKEVQELQKFLNTNGFIVNSTGKGSKGKESTVFGSYTADSIKKFQKANNIYPATGFFGPVTREYINMNFVDTGK